MERILVYTLFDLDADEYITGAATGVDAVVGSTLARLYPAADHRVFVPADRSRVDPWWARARPAGLAVRHLPEGSTYADRNAAIVAASTELMAYPLYAEHDPRSRRSGTWQTVRMARRAGLPTSTLVLSEALAVMALSE